MWVVILLAALLFSLEAPAQVIKYGNSAGPTESVAGWHILGGNAWNRTSGTCETGENDDGPSVQPSFQGYSDGGIACDLQTNPSPEYNPEIDDPVGTDNDEYLQLLGYTTPPTGLRYLVRFAELTDSITEGTYVLDGYVRYANIQAAAAILLTQYGGGTWTYPRAYLLGSPEFRIYCSGGGAAAIGISTGSASPNTWYKYRLEWNETGGKRNCAGVNHPVSAMEDDCVRCGCLFIDDVEVASCTAIQAETPFQGFDLIADQNDVDIEFDKNFMCRGSPPLGQMCGDKAMPKE